VRIRPERVAQLMKREIADILEHRMRDPRLGSMVSITDVEVTQDLSFARVYVSTLQSGAERDLLLETLGAAAGFVRHELRPRLGLREVPEVRFVLDESIERGARVDEILRKLSQGEPVVDEDEEEET
jgi:ribosome-binding factor A